MTQIGRKVREAVIVRLSDTTRGFNAAYNSIAASYNIPPINLNYTSLSQDFYIGQVNADDLEKSGIFKYPLMALYVVDATNQNFQKFAKFSGNIRVNVDFWQSWGSLRGLHDFEIYGDVFEQAFIDVLNRENNQNFGAPLVYNGDVVIKRGPVALGGQNWRQRITATSLFQVHTL